MEVKFSKLFLKDIEKIDNKFIALALKEVIEQIKQADKLSELSHLKKMKGDGTAFRVRIKDFRLGFFYENNIVLFSRFLHRKDVYKYFP